jgi:hypothetical protein
MRAVFASAWLPTALAASLCAITVLHEDGTLSQRGGTPCDLAVRHGAPCSATWADGCGTLQPPPGFSNLSTVGELCPSSCAARLPTPAPSEVPTSIPTRFPTMPPDADLTPGMLYSWSMSAPSNADDVSSFGTQLGIRSGLSPHLASDIPAIHVMECDAHFLHGSRRTSAGESAEWLFGGACCAVMRDGSIWQWSQADAQAWAPSGGCVLRGDLLGSCTTFHDAAVPQRVPDSIDASALPRLPVAGSPINRFD